VKICFQTNVINAKAVNALKEALSNSNNAIQAKAASWALGEIGKHSPDHAKSLAESDISPALFNAYKMSDASPEGKALSVKDRKSLKMIIEKCTYLPSLLPILTTLFNELLEKSSSDEKDINLMKCVLGRFANLLPLNSEQKKY